MRRKTSRIAWILAAVIALGACLTGCGKDGKETKSSKAEDDYELKVGYGTVLCQAPIQIAIEKGYLDDEGLKYQVVRMDGLVTDYIGSGDVDASYGLVSKFLQPIGNGLDITMTAGIHNGCIKLLVKPDSGIDKIADLKGKTVGVVALAEAPCVLLKRALHSVGVGVTSDNMEVNFVIYSNSDLALALDNGSVDAICLTDPAASVAINTYGYKTLLDNAVDEPYKDEYCCATFVTNDLAKNHPEIAAKFTRAVMKASAWVEENPQEAASLLVEKEYLTGDPKLLGNLLDSYVCKPSVQGGYDAVKNNVKEFVEIGLLDASTDVDAFIKKSFTFLDGVEETY